MTNQQPWDKGRDESAKAYASFLTFLDQPPEKRTLSEAARRTYGERGLTRRGNPVGRIRAWHDENDWLARAAAYDKHQRDIKSKEWEIEIAAAARRDAQEAQLIQAALLSAPRALAEEVAANGVAALRGIPINELVRLADRAGRGHALVGRFKRLSMGLGEGRIELTGADGGPIEMTIEAERSAARETLAPILGVDADRVVDELAEIRRRHRAARSAARKRPVDGEEVV